MSRAVFSPSTLPVLRNTEKNEPNNVSSELWLALNFPFLSLELLAQENASGAVVIIKKKGNKDTVLFSSVEATQLGVVPGMSLGAAFSLCPDLDVHDFDEQKQLQHLQQVADWAFQFSPRINLSPPDSLLFEIRGSIQYYGGLSELRKKIIQTLKTDWQHEFNIAISPTPAASLLLAKSARRLVVEDVTSLRSVLGDLPLSLLILDKKIERQLFKSGMRVLRDLWRLPPASLRRRFGIDLVDYLERILGTQPCLLSNYQAPLYFETSRELELSSCNYQIFLPLVKDTLLELCHFLHSHDVYCHHFNFYFQHEQHIPSKVYVGLRQNLRNAEHFFTLAETKIMQVKLVASVVSIKLVAKAFHAYRGKSRDLFPTLEASGREESDIDSLLEQLSARLGVERLSGISIHPDHRPEYAHRTHEAGMFSYTQIKKCRPFWLLSEPRQLFKRNNKLYYKGLIKFHAGPERLESGWWDSESIRRDYYIALDEIAGRLWIYNDLKDKRNWYLHGLFG